MCDESGRPPAAVVEGVSSHLVTPVSCAALVEAARALHLLSEAPRVG